MTPNLLTSLHTHEFPGTERHWSANVSVACSVLLGPLNKSNHQITSDFQTMTPPWNICNRVWDLDSAGKQNKPIPHLPSVTGDFRCVDVFYGKQTPSSERRVYFSGVPVVSDRWVRLHVPTSFPTGRDGFIQPLSTLSSRSSEQEQTENSSV